MNEERFQFYALYLTRFASGFGFITLVTLLPTYVNLFEASDFMVGLFTTAFTLAQTAAVVPLAWAGDRGDKRLVLAVCLALGVGVYVAFTLVGSSLQFVLVRGIQGVVVAGTSLLSLALVGELAPDDARANYIGKANAARFAAGVLGSLGAGSLYELYGFEAVYTVLIGLLLPALVGVWWFVDADEVRVRGNPFSGLAFNRRLLTLTSFRAQYAVAVTLVRTWVPIYAGITAARGGLAYAPFVVSLLITAEKLTNMLCQPYTGTLSDRAGRSLFVFVGGGCYGLVALAVPFTPDIGRLVGAPATFPVVGTLSAAFLPLLACNALLGVADSLREPASMALFADEGTDDGSVASSFGIRELVWKPGAVLAPMLGGALMGIGMEWVFFVGAAAAFGGVLTFLGILANDHGARALTQW
ncbi:MFS transporter [Halorussus salilacus]|uniref:MFS transporter n=1 Tax=Halorussus salilacus TaxID=2953750 RepID=UPI00209D5201|nr:MFS transporter [Halorussus salilacus]USZ69012.1 MFS transporter [Halorussus salilacus]